MLDLLLYLNACLSRYHKVLGYNTLNYTLSLYFALQISINTLYFDPLISRVPFLSYGLSGALLARYQLQFNGTELLLAQYQNLCTILTKWGVSLETGKLSTTLGIGARVTQDCFDANIVAGIGRVGYEVRRGQQNNKATTIYESKRQKGN